MKGDSRLLSIRFLFVLYEFFSHKLNHIAHAMIAICRNTAHLSGISVSQRDQKIRNLYEQKLCWNITDGHHASGTNRIDYRTRNRLIGWLCAKGRTSGECKREKRSCVLSAAAKSSMNAHISGVSSHLN